MKTAGLLGVGLCLWLPATAGLAQPGGQAEPPGVVVAEATVKAFPLSAAALGTARANESVEIRPEITAAIVGIGFEEGQFVEKGSVLVRPQDHLAAARVAADRATAAHRES